MHVNGVVHDQRFDFATRSNSSFFLMAYELEEPCYECEQTKFNVYSYQHIYIYDVICMQTLAALISSSAKHSAILFTFLKAASRAPVPNNYYNVIINTNKLKSPLQHTCAQQPNSLVDSSER